MKKTIFLVLFVLFIGLVTALKDFDKDGMPDSWEKKYNLKYDVDDANEDPDGDGVTNLQEYEQGTDPLVVDIKINIFKMIFGFFGKNIVKILLGIAALIIIYFVMKIISEFFKIKEKKKKEKERVVGKTVEKERYIPKEVYVPLNQMRKVGEKKIKQAFDNRRLKKFKRKHKRITHLTDHFEEKPEIEEELEPLHYSLSKKIRDIKKIIKPRVKPKKEKGSVFDRLPRRK